MRGRAGDLVRILTRVVERKRTVYYKKGKIISKCIQNCKIKKNWHGRAKMCKNKYNRDNNAQNKASIIQWNLHTRDILGTI